MPSAELRAVYLLAGSDRPKVERAVERLRSHFDPEAVERLWATEADGDEVVAACNTLGLFGGGSRLVLVEGVDRWKVADAKAVDDYLRSPTPDTVLALVGEGIKKESALAKACAKAGDVLVYETPRGKLSAWVADQFAREGARAEPEACRLLVELVGDGPRRPRHGGRQADHVGGRRRDPRGRRRGTRLLARGDASVDIDRRLGPSRHERGACRRASGS